MPKRFRNADQSTGEAARLNRKQPTPAEEILWEALRGRRLAGLKFRRQQPMSEFVVDFCCPQKRLIIEVDGGSHRDQIDYDNARTEHLTALGYRILRFTNDQVLNELDTVLLAIQDAAASAQH